MFKKLPPLVVAAALFFSFGINAYPQKAQANVLAEVRAVEGAVDAFSILARAGGLQKVDLASLVSLIPETAVGSRYATEMTLKALRDGAGWNREILGGWAMDLPEPVLQAAIAAMKSKIQNSDHLVKASQALVRDTQGKPLTYSITDELSVYAKQIGYHLDNGKVKAAANNAELGLIRIYSLITRAISAQQIISSPVVKEFYSLMGEIDTFIDEAHVREAAGIGLEAEKLDDLVVTPEDAAVEGEAALEVKVDQPVGAGPLSEDRAKRILGLYGRVKKMFGEGVNGTNTRPAFRVEGEEAPVVAAATNTPSAPAVPTLPSKNSSKAVTLLPTTPTATTLPELQAQFKLSDESIERSLAVLPEGVSEAAAVSILFDAQWVMRRHELAKDGDDAMLMLRLTDGIMRAKWPKDIAARLILGDGKVKPGALAAMRAAKPDQGVRAGSGVETRDLVVSRRHETAAAASAELAWLAKVREAAAIGDLIVATAMEVAGELETAKMEVPEAERLVIDVAKLWKATGMPDAPGALEEHLSTLAFHQIATGLPEESLSRWLAVYIYAEGSLEKIEEVVGLLQAAGEDETILVEEALTEGATVMEDDRLPVESPLVDLEEALQGIESRFPTSGVQFDLADILPN